MQKSSNSLGANSPRHNYVYWVILKWIRIVEQPVVSITPRGLGHVGAKRSPFICESGNRFFQTKARIDAFWKKPNIFPATDSVTSDDGSLFKWNPTLRGRFGKNLQVCLLQSKKEGEEGVSRRIFTLKCHETDAKVKITRVMQPQGLIDQEEGEVSI